MSLTLQFKNHVAWVNFFKRQAKAAAWLLVLSVSYGAHADTLYLASVHWPPFSGEQLRNQGACIAVTKAALDAVGHNVIVDFYPWSRAVRMASRNDSKYLGYLPEYSYPTDKFVFSQSMGRSGLGLLEQKSHPISWTQQSDLNQHTIGVVQGYVNTTEFDAMMAQGSQPFEVVSSDLHNVNKVATGRIDAAIIDEHVLQYILERPNMEGAKRKLQFNKKLLVYKELFIAFKNNEQGRKWRDRFNKGLVQINVQAILEENMKQ